MGDGMSGRSGCTTLIIVIAALIAGVLGYRELSRRWADEPPIGPMVVGFQRQNELTVFAAQVVAVPTTRVGGTIHLLDRTQTSIVPARVRYTVDLSKLRDRDVWWDAAGHTLTVTVPPVLPQPAELDGAAKRVFRTGPPAAAATWDQFDRSNMIKASREARTLAQGAELMRLAQAAARDAIAANAGLFLRGAGVTDAKVVVRFATEGSAASEPMDRSRSLDEVYRNAAK